MPRHQAEPHHASYVENLLHQRGAGHLRARKYGSAVLVESGPVNDPVKHFRLRRDTVHLWWLDMAPFVRVLTTSFRPSLMTSLGPSGPSQINPERTSDPEY
jgi:hypothetical protein